MDSLLIELIHSMMSFSLQPTALAPSWILEGNVGSNLGDLGFCLSYKVERDKPISNAISFKRRILFECDEDWSCTILLPICCDGRSKKH